MAKSKAARRFRQQVMQGQIQGVRMAPPRRTNGGNWDWITSTNGVDITGAPLTLNGWGGVKALSNTTMVGSQAVLIQPAPASSTPSIGRLRIDEIRGRISFDCNSVGGSFMSYVGIWVSDLNVTTTLWNMRQLQNGNEACRDDYLMLESLCWDAPNPSTALNADVLEMPSIELRIPQSVVIGGGQCLMVGVQTFAVLNPSATTSAYFNYRTRVGPVA
jgi:hypothetical protein